MNLTPEQMQAAMMEEQMRINEAERKRVERDAKKSGKLPSPMNPVEPNIINHKIKKQDEYVAPPAGPKPNPAMMPRITEELPQENLVGYQENFQNRTVNTVHVRGTVILEGYYTIDDLKKYIQLMEKYA